MRFDCQSSEYSLKQVYNAENPDDPDDPRNAEGHKVRRKSNERRKSKNGEDQSGVNPTRGEDQSGVNPTRGEDQSGGYKSFKYCRVFSIFSLQDFTQ